MTRFAHPRAVLLGVAWIAASNVVLLSLAAWNRSGPPVATLELTERELALPEGRQEERGAWMLKLLLVHDVPGPVRRTARWRNYELPEVTYDWFDRDKLRELGFATDIDPDSPDAEAYCERQFPRPVYLALEYDGDAWRRWLSRQEERAADDDARAVVALDRAMRSRLFPVDAAADAGGLLARYDEPGRYAVVRGLVRPVLVTREDGTPVLAGTVVGTAVEFVHVPPAFSERLQPFLSQEPFEEMDQRERNEARHGWPQPREPRYRAAIAIGRRLEPWLTGVSDEPRR